MRGDEKRVEDAFCAWLTADGWDVTRGVDFIDVTARRSSAAGEEVLYAEVKGSTEAVGTDIDTLYGQLLRRMTDERTAPPGVRWAAVVPSTSLPAVTRVPATIRALLRIEVFAVDADGTITAH